MYRAGKKSRDGSRHFTHNPFLLADNAIIQENHQSEQFQYVLHVNIFTMNLNYL